MYFNINNFTKYVGGGKHGAALLAWLYRRTEEPAPTSETCYWNKSKLSKAGSDIKFIKIKDLHIAHKSPQTKEPKIPDNFFQTVLESKKDTTIDSHL